MGCSQESVRDDDIVASWDDTVVTVAQFKDKMIMRYRNEATAEKKTLEERLDLAYEYINRELKLAEAIRLDYGKREDVQKAYKDAVESKAVDLLYNKMVRDSFFPEEMVREFYEHDKYEVRVRHILITMGPEVTADDTLPYWERMNDIYSKAKAGKNFIRLVDQYSEDESIDRKFHGDLGFFKWGKMVDEFQEAAWKLEPGKISPIVRTRYGYHIIQMIERRPTGLQVRTSHILMKVTRRASPAETTIAWDRAKMILEEAKKKGANFAQLARRYSEDDKTWVNGDVGWIPRGSMPSEYWDVALEMEVGQVDGPVRTYKGYHIIKVTDTRVNTPPLTDPETRDRVLSRLSRVYRDTIEVVAQQFIDSVKTAFSMEYNEEAVEMLLAKLGDKSIPTNMNSFAALTAEDREILILTDNQGGMKIDELVQQYGDHRFPPNFRNEKAFIEELVTPLILPRYLSVLAKEQGFFDNQETLKDGKRAANNMMLPEIERQMVFSKATPTEEEIAKYYEDNIEKYTEAAKATVYEIMVDDEQLANDLYSRIQKGERITTLALKYTLRTKAKRKKGKLGPFTKDKYGPVSRKAFELEEGELAGPIKADGIYSIIELIEKKPEVVKTLDDARRQIESDVRFRRQKDMKEAWVNELQSSFNLVVNEDVIKNVWALIDPLPEPMVEERKKWREDRRLEAEKAKLRAAENQIKLKLQPNTEQKFVRDGKEITVKIGEPRYKDKDGKEIDPKKSPIKLTPKGRIEAKPKRGEGAQSTPSIKLKPKPKKTP